MELQALLDRLTKLEAVNAELSARVETLETAPRMTDEHAAMLARASDFFGKFNAHVAGEQATKAV